MTFQQLQYLLAIHEAGSVSQAAKNLYVSQPSVSISLNTLEDELDFPIFIRSQKGLIPTAEGRRAIEYAKRICSAHALLTNIRKDALPVFRCSGAGMRFFNLAYARLVEEGRNKDLRFSSVSLSLDTTIQKLASCELDVGVLYPLSSWAQEVQTQLDNHNLTYQVLASLPIAIHLSAKHPLCSKPDILPQDLKGTALIEMPSREISNSICKGILPIDPENAIISTNDEMSLELVSRGLGYTVGVPYSESTCQRYRIRNIPLGNYSYTVTAITNPTQLQKPEATRFIELLKEELANFTAAD